MISIGSVFGNNEMTRIFDEFAVIPGHRAPAKLGNDAMVSIPGLEVDCAPYTTFFTPQGSDALEHQAACVEIRVRPFELAIVLVNHLWGSRTRLAGPMFRMQN